MPVMYNSRVRLSGGYKTNGETTFKLFIYTHIHIEGILFALKIIIPTW